jgi:hypothetical protein
MKEKKVESKPWRDPASFTMLMSAASNFSDEPIVFEGGSEQLGIFKLAAAAEFSLFLLDSFL